MSAYRPGSVGISLSPRPARDGVVLPEAPLAAVFASGSWNRMPVLLGSNRDEIRTFLADKPEHVRLLGGKLPLLRDRAAYAADTRMMSDAWRAIHVDTPADAMLAGGHADVWTYRFDWDEAPAIPFIRPDLLLGAAHAMEMPFVFADTAGEFDLFKVNTPFNRSGRQALCDAMAGAWTSFARQGAPALPGGAAWPRRTAGAGADSLVFDSPRGGGLRMAAARIRTDELKRRLMDSPWPPEWRCRIYARMLLWHPLFEGHGSEAEYRQWCTRLGVAKPAADYRPAVEV
jgi:para-nitrobenzyl esterase